MQLILVFECNNISQTDYKYVKDLMDAKYVVKHKITPIFAGGKNNLLSPSIIKKIENHKKDYDKNIVILFTDVDSISDPTVVDINKKIVNMCLKNGYDLVWFNKDIEEVFIGKQISSKDKNKTVDKFLSNHTVKTLDIKPFQDEKCLEHIKHSNICCVLDKYLKKR